ncbi:MAG: hypothetical protein IKZ87_06995, partial [Actinomycetaceae bacterium]|nr:hypothetical protein [Actinomycetaceae bacterium]
YPIGDTALVADSEGRISISGSCVALGYAGGARFDGTFHTSDCGGITDGKLEIFGRIDKAITSGGVTVIPEVLERNIEEIFDTQVAVIGVDDEKWGQAIIACIDKEIPSAREVLKEKLEVGWTPQRFVSLSELGFSDFPRLPSGKIDRNALTSLVIASF